MEKCDIGKSLNIHCHKTGFSRKQGFVQFKDLPCEKQEEIIWRANLKEKYSSIRIICCYHEQFYGKYFERKITKCCNPFGTHKESKKIAIKGNIKISIDMANYLQKNNVYVTPGWKFCSKCYKKTIETDEDLNSQEEWESKSEKKK
ncbi:ARL14 effector protein-like [Hydra vulgaris]|uniref:ARL14 effector protein-like n=1 Tax=Hydra vulgaris TaxID=6087 RepID=UPI000192719E